MAQIERRDLPVLQGARPAQPDFAPPVQPDFMAPARPDFRAPVYPNQPTEEWRPALPEASAPLQQQGAGSATESSLPYDLWRGLDAPAMERLLARVKLPSSSPAIAKLVARALAAGTPAESQVTAARLGGLERAGRVEEMVGLLKELAQNQEPGAAGRYAVALLAEGRKDEACAMELGATPPAGETRRAFFLVPAYCAAASGDEGGARLALDLARDNEVALAAGGGRIDVLDYLFLRLERGTGNAGIADKATPELLFLLARDQATPAELRLAAAERAAALNVIDGTALGAAYREVAPKLAKSAQTPAALRAKLFAALEGQSSAKIRAESIDALLASGKDAKIEIPMAEALARASADLARETQAPRFAETGVRVAALAGEDETAWDWTLAGSEHVRSWQLALAATDPFGGRAQGALDAGVDIAFRAELPGPLLQRLVTVLDALGEEVPIPLWELAAKTPQPDDGYLPETGLLSMVKEAADAGEVGRTVLLVAAALGPDGPQGTHLIALGDGLRALKRVGLDAEARRIALEALYAHWPSRGKV